MAKEISIRKALSEDLNAIVSLWQELMDFHKEIDPYFGRSSDGHVLFRDLVSGHIESDDSCLLVAEEEGGGTVGYSLATLARHLPVFENGYYGAILDIAVTERCRRQGIGERLYRQTESWFKRIGIHRIEVRVAVSNEASAAFWWKMDFCPYITTEVKNI